jgi:hypothetical protein
MGRKPKRQIKLAKLPVIEWAYRWIDVFTYFDYPQKIRDDAYNILTEKAPLIKGSCKPSNLGGAAVYIACQKNSEEFDGHRIEAIMRVFFAHRKMRFGLTGGENRMRPILDQVRKWKSAQESSSGMSAQAATP